MTFRIPTLASSFLLALLLVGCSGGVVVDDRGIEEFPDEGRTHVPDGTLITYRTDPPTSGSHYPTPQAGGFYTSGILPGYLVHTMEHGGIIIYYNPDTVTAQQQDDLKTILNPHIGQFATVVALPRN